MKSIVYTNTAQAFECKEFLFSFLSRPFRPGSTGNLCGALSRTQDVCSGHWAEIDDLPSGQPQPEPLDGRLLGSWSGHLPSSSYFLILSLREQTHSEFGAMKPLCKTLAWGESLPLSSGRTHATQQSCPVGLSKENMGFRGKGGGGSQEASTLGRALPPPESRSLHLLL